MIRRILAFGVACVTTFGLGAPSARAGLLDATCRGEHRGETFTELVLVVPAGGECELFDSTVVNNVSVEPGAYLLMSGTSVGQNVVARQSTVQIVSGSSIGGSVVLLAPVDRVFGDFESGTALCGTTVRGNLHISGAPGFARIVVGGLLTGTELTGCADYGGGNTIGGALVDVLNDTTESGATGGPSGVNVIENNHIGAALVCIGNTPAPTGGGNTAAVKIGQCAGL